MKFALTAALLFAAPFVKATPVYYSVLGTVVGIPTTLQASIKAPDFIENLPGNVYVAKGDAILACNVLFAFIQPCQEIQIITSLTPTNGRQIRMNIFTGPNMYELGNYGEYRFPNVPVSQFGYFISDTGQFSLEISPTSITPEPSSASLSGLGLIGGTAIFVFLWVKSKPRATSWISRP